MTTDNVTKLPSATATPAHSEETMKSIPESVLTNHTAILGKTGSGKTSTTKLFVEQVVAAGARVCILDPIKSDHWGLISSADGKRPGLPFHILGGPRGHVPLHAQAGKAIGEIVASGALPLSIIDMADFDPGGHSKFFADFAQTLFRKMTGILYLVVEEAHEFAPKERTGFGAENMSIHWAKKLATASRTKGIKLIVCSQRVQKLHNDVLGSCETLIAHRFTTPADQKPVVDWLKANLKPEQVKEVAESMSSLSDGEGWVCSGESKIFLRHQFPRIKTYDNSATPTDNLATHSVKTAPVDQEKLRAIIGSAVQEAENNDPRRLKARIVELEREAAKKVAPVAVSQAALAEAERRGRELAYGELQTDLQRLNDALNAFGIKLSQKNVLFTKPRAAIAGATKVIAPPPRPDQKSIVMKQALDRVAGMSQMSKAERLILTALAQYPQGRTKKQIAVLTSYAVNGGGFNNALGSLRSHGWMEGDKERMTITPAGLDALGPFDPLPHGDALLQSWKQQLGKAERLALGVLVSAYPETLTKEEVAERCDPPYAPNGGGFNNALGRLRSLELISGSGNLVASENLFG